MKKRITIKKTVFYFAAVAVLALMLSAFCFAANVSKPAISKISIAKRESTSVTLEWDVSGKAAGYIVYRYNPKNKKFYQLKKLRAKTYTVTGLAPGEYYVFTVKPYYTQNRKTMNGKAKSKTAYTTLDAVEKITQKTTEPYSHRLSWTKVKGADMYEVCYYKKEAGKYVSLGGSEKNTCNLTRLNPASVYKYKIRALSVTSNGKCIYSKFSKPFVATTGVPAVKGFKTSSETLTGYKLEWNAEQTAQGYYLYRFSDETGDYERIAILNATDYTVTGKESAERDSYKICAYATVNGKRVFGEMSAVLGASTRPESITLYKGDDLPKNNRVKLEWDSCEKADGYFIYASNDPESGFTLLKDISDCATTEAVIGGLENTVLYFRIKSYVSVNGSCIVSKESNTVRVFV